MCVCCVCRYIRGCPRIDGNVEIRMVKYLEDRSGNIQKTLTSKISQKKLENAVQYQLETEVKQLPDLCQLLESVTTARDFLLEIGGRPDRSLVDFMVSWTHQNIIRLIDTIFCRPDSNFMLAR